MLHMLNFNTTQIHLCNICIPMYTKQWYCEWLELSQTGGDTFCGSNNKISPATAHHTRSALHADDMSNITCDDARANQTQLINYADILHKHNALIDNVNISRLLTY